MASKKYSFKLKSDLSELDTLCQNLEKCGQVLKIPKKCLFEINLALDELFTNIISYGFNDDSEHKIKVTITPQDDTLVVCVEDDGVPFNPMNIEDPDLPCSIEECKIGGLGIHLIKKLMDDICYERCRGKNVLTLKKSLDAN